MLSPTSENGEIITGINYHGKNTAACMFNNYIQKVTTDSNERLYDFTPLICLFDVYFFTSHPFVLIKSTSEPKLIAIILS